MPPDSEVVQEAKCGIPISIVHSMPFRRFLDSITNDLESQI